MLEVGTQRRPVSSWRASSPSSTSSQARTLGSLLSQSTPALRRWESAIRQGFRTPASPPGRLT